MKSNAAESAVPVHFANFVSRSLSACSLGVRDCFSVLVGKSASDSTLPKIQGSAYPALAFPNTGCVGGRSISGMIGYCFANVRRTA